MDSLDPKWKYILENQAVWAECYKQRKEQIRLEKNRAEKARERERKYYLKDFKKKQEQG